ncbi:MAG TPA: hypothetical protein DHV28_09055 [Ignavibacteriales bacterium]|nr:hypothetical protein [Ignavibacteriales bacterium]
MKNIKTSTIQPELFDLTKINGAQVDKLIGREDLKDKVAIISGSEVDLRRFVAINFSYEGANVIIVHHSNDNDIELIPEIVKINERKINIKKKDINKPIRNKTVMVFGDINIQINNTSDQKQVENLKNQNQSSFVTQQLDNPENLTTAGSDYLTSREKQVISKVADGFTNKEIAQQLNVSTYTVKSHVHNILIKLSLNTRIQIAKHAYQSEYYKNAI